MIFKWESEEERLLKFMRISPKKKMEWLRQMNEFLQKAGGKRRNEIFRRLREAK